MISVKNYKNPYLVPNPIPLPVKKQLDSIELEIVDKQKGRTYIKLGIAAGIIALMPELALANTGIDAEAKRIYFGEFIGIAKWVIVVKGGWDTLHKALSEDFEGAKKSFLQYLIVFAILLGLPTGLDKIQTIFERIGEA